MIKTLTGGKVFAFVNGNNKPTKSDGETTGENRSVGLYEQL